MLTVQNDGPDPATKVQLTESIPSGLPLVYAGSSRGDSFRVDGGTMVFELGGLAGREKVTFTFVFAAKVPGIISNAAQVHGSEADPFPRNNMVTQVTSVEPLSGAMAFVTALYQDVLGRAPDAAGLATWLQSTYSGVSQAAIAHGFWISAEHRGLQIDRLYGIYLHRAADSAGRAMWVQALMLGVSEAEVTRQFLLSQEYMASHGTAADFVNGLYADVLKRFSDPSGAAFWQGLLAAGASRDSVVQAFLNSDEAYIHTVDRYYFTYLHSIPSAAAEHAWVTQLQSHFIGTDQLAEALLLSGL
jgi:hypothetical protein